MVSLSLCMIVKNEEDVLERCLLSAMQAADEIVVVDTGSTDSTIEIARNLGAKVFHFDWIDDFSAARNFAFAHATSDYIMWLDADDVLLCEDLAKLLELKTKLDCVTRQVAARYNVGFDEQGNVTLSYWRERIFLRSAGFIWKDCIHETIGLEQNALYVDFAVTHKKLHPTPQGRNLRIFEKMIANGVAFEPRQTYYYARELYYNNRIEDALAKFEEFIASNGWTEDKISASVLMARALSSQGEKNKAILALCSSFLYAPPRAEVCCEIGHLFCDKNEFDTAIYWYNCALRKTDDGKNGAFVSSDCYGFIPLIQLAVCYDRLRQFDKANEFNEQAALIKPDSKAVISNRLYFDEVLKPSRVKGT